MTTDILNTNTQELEDTMLLEETSQLAELVVFNDLSAVIDTYVDK